MGAARKTTQTADNPVVAHVVAFLKEREKDLEDRLKDIRAAIPLLSTATDGTTRYQVNLGSLWADSGEQSVSIARKGSVASVVRRAANEFKRINRRSDVQATWDVYALIGEREDPLMVPVPEALWAGVKREFS